MPNPAGGADQHCLPQFEAAAVEQRLPRRQPGNGERRRLLVAQRLGLDGDRRRGGGGVLAVAAARRDSENPVSGGEAVCPRYRDGSGDVFAEHGGKFALDETAAVFPVDGVDRCSLHLISTSSSPGSGRSTSSSRSTSASPVAWMITAFTASPLPASSRGSPRRVRGHPRLAHELPDDLSEPGGLVRGR